jgi:tRNA (guanine26-N2/guanine27-N2)-dimethyltransferase
MWKEIVEGETRLRVPVRGSFGSTAKGKVRKPPVFFNPRMELNRDIACAFVRARRRIRGKIAFADLLAGTGAKGIRVAKEGGRGVSVALNDENPQAREAIQENARLNGVKVEISNTSAHRFLLDHHRDFNFIDIDPFGSPVPFLDGALLALRAEGVLGITATDTAPLCGVYPLVCYRKYGAIPHRGWLCREAGLRILVGYTARTAAKYAQGMRVLLSHSTHHYSRCYVEVRKGKGAAKESLQELGYLYSCPACLSFEARKELLPAPGTCPGGHRWAVSGPLWLGPLREEEHGRRVLEEGASFEGKESGRLLRRIVEELDLPFYHDLHRIAKLLKTDAPPMEGVMETLEGAGYRVTRTHFTPLALKTDAPVEAVKEAIGR